MNTSLLFVIDLVVFYGYDKQIMKENVRKTCFKLYAYVMSHSNEGNAYRKNTI